MSEKIDDLVATTKACALLAVVVGDIIGIVLIILSGVPEHMQHLDKMVGVLMVVAGIAGTDGEQA
jgi:hypothetical protein